MFLTDNDRLTFGVVREFYDNNVASRLEVGDYNGAARHLEVLEEGLNLLHISYRGEVYFERAEQLKKMALTTSSMLRKMIYEGDNDLEQLSEHLHATLMAGEKWTNKPKRTKDFVHAN